MHAWDGDITCTLAVLTFVGRRYQFSRHKLFYTDVSVMLAYCAQNDDKHEELKDCILISTTTGFQLPVIFKGSDKEVESLGSCDVIDVCIIHDCMARKLLQVTAKLDGDYYLHVSLRFNKMCYTALAS